MGLVIGPMFLGFGFLHIIICLINIIIFIIIKNIIICIIHIIIFIIINKFEKILLLLLLLLLNLKNIIITIEEKPSFF